MGIDPEASAAQHLPPGPVATNPKQRILIAEDNATARKQLQQLLEARLNVVVETVGDGKEALEALIDRPFSAVVTDLKMPKVSGMELIEEVKKRRLPVAVIVTTGYGSIGEAVQAIQLGATDFLTKPLDLNHLQLVLGRALRERALQYEVMALREQLHERYAFHDVLSKSPKMHAVFELVGNVGKTGTTVLIEGETGTGKEMVARAVHQASHQRTGPFVAVNCAAVPETLLESELFGHEKGAFTNAVGQRKGRFELAHGGTLFLDEVGDVPAAMQAKLLRVLQERRFERVGGTATVEIDVRVVAATNRSLQKMVQDAKFREDLYYRLNVLKIELPPLRDRPEDIPLLVAHFCEKYSFPGVAVKKFAPETMKILLRYQWPGNIRELENAVERACVTTRDEWILPVNLPPEVIRPAGAKKILRIDLRRPLKEQLAEVTAAFEKRFLRRALKKARYQLARTARIAGMSRRTLDAKLAHYKIDSAGPSPK